MKANNPIIKSILDYLSYIDFLVISLVGFLENSKDEYKKKRDQKPSWRKRENHIG